MSRLRAVTTSTDAVPRRVALVTAGSRGLGRAIALRLARDGFAVAVNHAGDRTRAQQVVDAIEREGGAAAAVVGDVTDEDQVTRLAAAVAADLGPVDVVVLNADGRRTEAPLGELSWEEHLAPLGVAERRSGRIVQVDAADRRAQAGLMRSWARELAPLGITVNTVVPSVVVEPDAHEDVAHAVSFVASEAARLITGQRIVVDGGRGLAA